jgi:hypothetical protein
MQTDFYMNSQENARNNAILLLKEVARLQKDKENITKKLETTPINLDTMDGIEKLEEELKFLTSYTKNLLNQAVVLINQNNLNDMPSLESLMSQV